MVIHSVIINDSWMISGTVINLGNISARPHCDRALEIMVSKGNHPQMAELFRLVNYNLPR